MHLDKTFMKTKHFFKYSNNSGIIIVVMKDQSPFAKRNVNTYLKGEGNQTEYNF